MSDLAPPLAVSPLVPDHGSFFLIGKPKCGKTCLAGTFPKPMTIVDFDGGTMSLLHNPTLREAVEAGLIHVIKVPRNGVRSDITIAFNEASARVKAGLVRTLVIDPLTAMLNVLKRTALELDGFDVEDDEPDKAIDWRHVVPNINTGMDYYLTKVLSWPVHLVVTAHEEERDEMRTAKDRKGNPIQVPTGAWNVVPIAFGARRYTLAADFNEVWHVVRVPAGAGSKHIVRPSESRRQYSGFGSRMDLSGELPADFPTIMQQYREGKNSSDALATAFLREGTQEGS